MCKKVANGVWFPLHFFLNLSDLVVISHLPIYSQKSMTKLNLGKGSDESLGSEVGGAVISGRVIDLGE